MSRRFNARVLVIDDDEAVRESFREILAPPPARGMALERAGEALFGDRPRAPRFAASVLRFDVDVAANGAQGLESVQHSLAEGRPYAVAFVDMRMPGWDGLETVQQIREHDRHVEIIFVTAYTDHAIDDIVARAGANVGYHCKPFVPDVIRQLATKAVYDWNRTAGLEALIRVMGDLRASARSIDSLLENVLTQVAELLGSHSALVVRRRKDGTFDGVVASGGLRDPRAAEEAIASMRALDPGEEVLHDDRFVFLPLKAYGAIVAARDDQRPLATDRLPVVRLFLEHAAQAIENVSLHENLLRQEKLSAVGRAVSMISHDLRGPLGNVRNLMQLAQGIESAPESLREIHDLTLASAEEALALVNDLLDFLRNVPPETASTTVAELEAALAPALRAFEREFRATIAVQGESTLALHGDRRKLVRVLTNLVRNGLEAQRGKAHAVVTIAVTELPDAIAIDISDEGSGVPANVRAHLFEPFTTHGKSGGTGLGLAIARQIATAHGGSLELRATGPSGTTFRLTLPRT